MSSIPVGSKVLSSKGQTGVVVPRTGTLWPTFVQVKWDGASFVTFEDPHKLEVVSTARTSRKSPTAAQRERQARVIDVHAAMLARARNRAGALA